MNRYLLILTSMLATATIAIAQPPAPLGPVPTFNVVRSPSPDKGTVHFARFVTVTVPEFVQEKILENGKEVIVTRTVYRTETREELIVVDVAKGRVITPDSKQLPIDEVWKRLKPNTVVVLSGSPNPPSPPFLRALSPETLVIIPPIPKK